MNYFAHGRAYLSQPYFLAGTAVPDWLSVVDRRMRVRSKHAQPFFNHKDPVVAQLARGVAQHHHDDRWFHQSPRFNALSLKFTVVIRDLVPDDRGFRPSFLGHILVELLLDSHLIAAAPARLDEYYAALENSDHQQIEAAINIMATRQSPRLAELIGRFCRERFLYDYQEDAKLLMRLNHVMKRVKLPPIPDRLLDWLPEARIEVGEYRDELVTPTNSVLPADQPVSRQETDDAADSPET